VIVKPTTFGMETLVMATAFTLAMNRSYGSAAALLAAFYKTTTGGDLLDRLTSHAL
jgi:hypothetical protein